MKTFFNLEILFLWTYFFFQRVYRIKCLFLCVHAVQQSTRRNQPRNWWDRLLYHRWVLLNPFLPTVPTFAVRETDVSRTANVWTVGMNGLTEPCFTQTVKFYFQQLIPNQKFWNVSKLKVWYYRWCAICYTETLALNYSNQVICKNEVFILCLPCQL